MADASQYEHSPNQHTHGNEIFFVWKLPETVFQIGSSQVRVTSENTNIAFILKLGLSSQYVHRPNQHTQGNEIFFVWKIPESAFQIGSSQVRVTCENINIAFILKLGLPSQYVHRPNHHTNGNEIFFVWKLPQNCIPNR
jgi:hypothetical protein